MSREEWRALYGKARAAYAAVRQMRKDGELQEYERPGWCGEAADACPGYTFSRLTGDYLGLMEFGILGSRRSVHYLRMCHLKDRVRLPA